MKPSVQLQIPTPCHEKWAEMTPENQGRFCHSCSKTVVDFSTMTDQQILSYLAKSSGNVCARMNESQLMRDIKPMPVPPKTRWWMALAMPLLLLFNKVAAQPKLTGKVATAPKTPEKQLLKLGELAPQKVNISGVITDSNGVRVPLAAVTILGTQQGVTANEQGEYSLEIATYADSMMLEVSCVGYNTTRLQVATTNKVKKDILLQARVKELAPVIVTGYNTITCRTITGSVSKVSRRTLYTIIKDTVTSLLTTNTRIPRLSVAPNPVQRHQQVSVFVKDMDNYTLQVINNSGVVLYVQSYKSAKGKTPHIALPASCLPGLYYMRLVETESQKQYTEKFIVL